MTPESVHVIPPQTQGETDIMKTVFQLFDQNADGMIDNSEFGTLIRAIGYNASNKQIREALDKYDKNRDGVLDFGEFVIMAKEIEGCSKDRTEENLRDAFRVFDRDRNGVITVDELRYIVTTVGEKLSEEEAEELIAMFDTNKDGKLQYEEFVEWTKGSLNEYITSLNKF